MEEKQKKKRIRTRAEIEHDRRYREIRREFADGKMPLLLRRYLAYCGHDDAEELFLGEGFDGAESEKANRSASKGSGKRSAKEGARILPNPAGFCRFLELERDAYGRLEAEFPTEAGRMRAVFEDEALNSELPASVLGFYLKYLLGAEDGDPSEAKGENGEILVTFAHDILSDGR